MRPLRAGVIAFVCASALATVSRAQPALLTPAQQDVQLAALAADAARRGPATPIPLIGQGPRAIGAMYDRFHVGVLIARAQIAASQSPDAAAIGAHPAWQSRGTVIVAYPIDCDGKPNQPLAIRVSGPPGPISPAPIGEAVRGASATGLLPGISLPADALVLSFRNVPPAAARIEIDYAGPACGGAAKTATLELLPGPSKSLLTSLLGVKLPSDLTSTPSPATVRMQALLDVDGRVRFAQQVQGPIELGPAAKALLEGRTFDPWTINGVAVAHWTFAPIVFTATGEPAQPEPFRLPPASDGGVTLTGTSALVRAAPPPAPRPAVAPAPPGQSDTQLARLAIETAQRGDPAPISLHPVRASPHGVLFDRFLIGVLRARAAAAAGTPLDPAAADPSLVRNDPLVVAFPLTCPGGAVAPADVQLAAGAPTPGALRAIGSPLTGASLVERLPGVTVPDGAVGRAFASAPLGQNLEVRIAYQGRACPGETNVVALPIQWIRGGGVSGVRTVKLPPEAASLTSPVTVQLRGLVDQEGRYRFPTLADGPAELEAAAQTAAATWRFEPYRANGVAVPTFVITPMTFTATGMPEPAAAPGPGARGQPPPEIIANTTVGGRPATISSAAVPGLNAATSKCAIADEDGYGYSAANAIKVGGGFRDGPALERKYLGALRGPNGEGLRAVRLGSTQGTDGTILDLYELTYPGLAQPLRLYLDEYHTETLKAPKGLVCADPIGK